VCDIQRGKRKKINDKSFLSKKNGIKKIIF